MKRLSRRIRAAKMESPLDRWCQWAVLGSCILGIAALCVIALDAGRLRIPGLIGVTGMMFFPRIIAASEEFLHDTDTVRRMEHSTLLWTSNAIFIALCLYTSSPVLLLGWAHGVAAARPRRDASVAIALTLGAVEGLWVAVGVPGATGAGIFALSLMVSTVGGTWLHARVTRRNFLRTSSANDATPETPAGLSARSMTVGMLAGAIILSIALLEAGINTREHFRSEAADTAEANGALIGGGRPSGTGASGERFEEGGEVAEAERKAKQAARLRVAWPEAIDLDGSLQPGQERVMAEVACSLDRKDKPYYNAKRPLYLRARSFDTLGPEGLSSSLQVTGTVHTDDGTGYADGWVELIVPRPRRATAIYDIRMRDHRVADDFVDRHATLLLHTAPLLRVELPSVRVVGDRGVYGIPPDDGLFEYRWNAMRWNELLPVASFAERSPRYTDLPLGDSRVRQWASEAKQLTEGIEDRDEIVARVVEHFESGWSYDLSPAPASAGLDALEQFFTERRGYCSYYATAVMIYLRAHRIPCRIATGYRITRYHEPGDDRKGYYRVFTSDAHAWLEVALEQDQWRTIDPTPRAAYEAAMAQIDEAKDLPNKEPMAQAETDEAESTLPVGESESREHHRGVVAWLARNFQYGGGRAFGMVVALLVAVLIQAATMFAIRRLEALRSKKNEDLFDERAATYWRKLVKRLRSYGFHPRRGQTPLEYAASVRRRGGPLFAGIEPVVHSLYRRRFGHQSLNAKELEMLDNYAELIASDEFEARFNELTGRRR